jgi:3-hydroxybutyrate dehydrogenase
MSTPFLAGRVTLVTGSTSGMGLAIATRLAESGATVAVHGLGTPQVIDAALAQVTAAGRAPIKYFPGDLTNVDEVEKLVDDVQSSFGPIDILVNNAGVQHVSPIGTFPIERWHALIATNLTAAFITIRRVVDGMRERGWGRIVNIASVNGLIGVANKAAYCASKHGLVGLTKVVAMETATSPVTCNAICPGWVLTPLVEKQIELRATQSGLDYESAKRALLTAKQPSQEFVTTQQVAGLVAFLCTSDADQVRGVAWNIDGGYVAT